jgi:2-dehydro-3-deoxyphosphogluconate aldolase/(4S)-4-hydroxy-2-oxoglutarate aldolase
VSADRFVSALERGRVLPLIRTDSAATAYDQATALIARGAHVVEITTTVPEWARLVRELCGAAGGPLVGAGTIRGAAHAEDAVAAGADFLVSPYPVPAARPIAEAAGVPFLEGGLTPGEVLTAAERGPAKLFPAHIGGVAYLRGLLAIAPDARIVATGGLTAADAGEWVAAGALAIGVRADRLPVDGAS